MQRQIPRQRDMGRMRAKWRELSYVRLALWYLPNILFFCSKVQIGTHILFIYICQNNRYNDYYKHIHVRHIDKIHIYIYIKHYI